MHPRRTLSAPVTEIVVVSQRADRVFTPERAWEMRVSDCVSQLKAGLYAVDGAYPPLLWGELRQMPGCYMMLVGWDGVEVGFPSPDFRCLCWLIHPGWEAPILPIVFEADADIR